MAKENTPDKQIHSHDSTGAVYHVQEEGREVAKSTNLDKLFHYYRKVSGFGLFTLLEKGSSRVQ